MELEFDNEMDAILRKARAGRDPSTAVGEHLDADSIAAFAEGAVPRKAMASYVRHFADCDRCRKMLAASMGEAFATEPARAAVIPAPVGGPVVPWFQRLFATRNLAIAMGALVIVLAVGLGIVVLDRQKADQNASVAHVTNNERSAAQAPPYAEPPPVEVTNSNSAMGRDGISANSSAPFAAANRAQSEAQPTPAKPASVPGGTTTGTTASDAEPIVSSAPTTEDRVSAATAAPPPPAPMAKSAPEKDDRADRDEEAKLAETNRTATMSRKKEAVLGGSRDLPPPPSKGGPVRSGPLNVQTQQNSNIFDMPVTRRAGGKSFNNRDGVWYDSSYRSQGTVNFRRGTREYRDLDSGLRSIADTLGGTVVVVWKGKAYRIQ